MNVLGIETSCDETAAAVVADGRHVRSNAIASQIALHRSHGGVVPELAARGHLTAIVPVVEAALTGAGIGRDGVDAVAVTDGPGLAGSLLVGVNAAKGFAYALGKPLLPVNHLEAHLYANWLVDGNRARESDDPPAFPAVCLLVSGGHTELILMTGHGAYRHLGGTLDDAAGEAFDKGARWLGLGYPGGPAIERAARDGDPARFPLPRAWLGGDEEFGFSFSGLKTALRRLTDPYRLPDPPPAPSTGPFPEHRPPLFRPDLPVADLAASYQDAVIDVLATKTVRAAFAQGARTVLLAGGVAANAALRARLGAEMDRHSETGRVPPIPVRWPPPALCTDNAAMVAAAAFFGRDPVGPPAWDLDVHPRHPLGSR